jgi:GntR family transcriptional repressor for pyruvate dehydrogenase complex
MPTEQMLVARFGVSRAVVREAISRLKSDGLVVSRRGSGLYVAPPARGRSFRLDAGALATDLAEVGAVLELREAVEVAAAGLAARRRTPAQLAAIGRAHEAMASTGDWDGEGVAADIGFHRAVAEATGNARFAGFITFLGDSLAEVIRASRAAAGEPDGARRVTVEEHARILAAVGAADAAGARRAARAHLRGASGGGWGSRRAVPGCGRALSRPAASGHDVRPASDARAPGASPRPATRSPRRPARPRRGPSRPHRTARGRRWRHHMSGSEETRCPPRQVGRMTGCRDASACPSEGCPPCPAVLGPCSP